MWNSFCCKSVCRAMALSLPPLQQKRMGSDIFQNLPRTLDLADCRIGRGKPRPYRDLRLAEKGAMNCAPTTVKRLWLVAAAEGVADAGLDIAAKSRVAQGILVLLVEKILRARVERHAVADVVVRGDIEERVAWIAGEAEAEKVRVGANSGEIAADRHAEAAIGGVQGERSGIHGTAGEMVSGELGGIERVGSFEYTAIVVGVVPCQVQPASNSGVAG